MLAPYRQAFHYSINDPRVYSGSYSIRAGRYNATSSFRLVRQIEHECRTRYFVNMDDPVQRSGLCMVGNRRATRASDRVRVEARMTSQKKTRGSSRS